MSSAQGIYTPCVHGFVPYQCPTCQKLNESVAASGGLAPSSAVDDRYAKALAVVEAARAVRASMDPLSRGSQSWHDSGMTALDAALAAFDEVAAP